MTDETTTPQPRCIHLRCKSMMVYGEDFEQDPEYDPVTVDFWCLETSRNTGPDGGEVSMECCTEPERTCFKEYLE